MSQLQQSQTLQTLVSTIHISKSKSKQSSDQSEERQLPLRKKWRRHQQSMLYQLIGLYGSDFSLIQIHFPQKTRKQIKKKYHQVCALRDRKLFLMQKKIERQRRKSAFEQEILEQGMSFSSENEK